MSIIPESYTVQVHFGTKKGSGDGFGKYSSDFSYLSLEVVPRDDVTHGPQGWGLHGGGGVDEQLNKTLTHTSLDDRLNLIVLSIREIAQGPASVRKNLQ